MGDRRDDDRGRDGPRERDGVSVLVRNLTFKVDKNELQTKFEAFGTVKDVYIPLDYVTREPRGFAFIEMSTKDEADEVIEKLDGAEIDGRVVKVLLAAQKRKRPEEMARVDPRSQRNFGGNGDRYGGGRGRSPPRYGDRYDGPPRGGGYGDRRGRSPPRGGGRYDDRRRSRSRSRSYERRRDDRRRRDDDDEDDHRRRRRDRSPSRSASGSRSRSRRRD